MDLGLSGKTAVVTGGAGVICGAIASALCEEGARVAIWDISEEAAAKKVKALRAAGATATAVRCDAGNRADAERALEQTQAELGRVDVLVNGAGGSRAEATTSPKLDFFSIDTDAMQSVFGLNFLTAVVVSQAVGRAFADAKHGVILNISSIAGFRPLTKSVAYCAGKAALNNFTQWLAVHMASHYSPDIRVNALAPGFVLSEQNRFLMLDSATGELTERGRLVLRHVPLARLGTADDMTGAALWLVSEKAKFVTGAVIPVDGGFTAQAGV